MNAPGVLQPKLVQVLIAVGQFADTLASLTFTNLTLTVPNEELAQPGSAPIIVIGCVQGWLQFPEHKGKEDD